MGQESSITVGKTTVLLGETQAACGTSFKVSFRNVYVVFSISSAQTKTQYRRCVSPSSMQRLQKCVARGSAKSKQPVDRAAWRTVSDVGEAEGYGRKRGSGDRCAAAGLVVQPCLIISRLICLQAQIW